MSYYKNGDDLDPANGTSPGSGSGYGYSHYGMFGGAGEGHTSNAPDREDGYALDSNHPGKARDNSEFGGYRGVRRPDGTMDWTQSGRGDEEKYYQGMGAAAANRQAYQVNFDQANQDRANALQARGYEGDAADTYRRTAMGEDSQAQVLGHRTLHNAQQQQMGAAVSGGGDALARASALRQQQNNQGAFMSRGNQVLAAQKADEMARAREGWMQAQTQQRQDDLMGQGLSAQQAQMQGQSEQKQRQLNDQGQLWGEEQAFDVNAASQKGGLDRQGLNTTSYEQTVAQRQADRDRSSKYGNAAAGAISSGVAGGLSDERAKSDIVRLVRSKKGGR